MYKSRIFWMLIVTCCLGACATNVGGYIVPGEVIDKDAVYLIDVRDDDDRGLDQLLYKELKSRGFNVYLDDETDDVSPDVLVSYDGQWYLDITWYLLDFGMRFYQADSNLLIASAQSNRTSLARIKPEKMVQEAIDKLLNSSNSDY